MLGVEAGVDRTGVPQAPHTQARANKQYGACSDLAGHKHAAQSGFPITGWLRFVLEIRSHLDSCAAECWSQPERHTANHRDHHRENQHSPVNGEPQRNRQTRWFQRQQERGPSNTPKSAPPNLRGRRGVYFRPASAGSIVLALRPRRNERPSPAFVRVARARRKLGHIRTRNKKYQPKDCHKQRRKVADVNAVRTRNESCRKNGCVQVPLQVGMI